MKRQSYSKLLSIISLLALTIISLCGCNDDFSREYHDDICISLEDRDAEIIIKEWQFLLGSGAEIYFKKNNELTLIGKTTGGDDGFCPFKEGQYSIEITDDTVTVSWSRHHSDEKTNWATDSYQLPTE